MTHSSPFSTKHEALQMSYVLLSTQKCKRFNVKFLMDVLQKKKNIPDYKYKRGTKVFRKV